jgi:hypothetical protein
VTIAYLFLRFRISVFLHERVLEKTLRLIIRSLVDSFHLTGPTEKEDYEMDRGVLHLSALNSCIRGKNFSFNKF